MSINVPIPKLEGRFMSINVPISKIEGRLWNMYKHTHTQKKNNKHPHWDSNPGPLTSRGQRSAAELRGY